MFADAVNDDSDSSASSAQNDDRLYADDDSDLDIPPGELAPNKEDAVCLFCDEEYRKDERGSLWIQCNACEQWAHSDCTDCERDAYVCDFCREG